MEFNAYAIREKFLGNDFYKCRMYEEAIKHYDRSLSIDRNDMRVYLNKAMVYLDMSNFDECINQCEIAIQVGRKNGQKASLIAKAHYRIGSAYLKKNDLNKADFFFKLSYDTEQSKEAAEKRLEIEKNLNIKKSMHYREIAYEYENCDQHELAIEFYTKAISCDPNNFKFYYYRAIQHAYMQNHYACISDCNECIRIEPTFPKAYLWKGVSLENLGCPEEGLENFSLNSKYFEPLNRDSCWYYM